VIDRAASPITDPASYPGQPVPGSCLLTHDDCVPLAVTDTGWTITVDGADIDIDTALGRLGARKAGPRDLKALEHTLAVIPEIQSAMTKHKAVHAWLEERRPFIDQLIGIIAKAIMDDAPVKPNQGGFIRDGYDEELDKLRSTGSDVQAWLYALEAKERKTTGIGSLRA
jgi:DNA mismatch repair ATPase MutS